MVAIPNVGAFPALYDHDPYNPGSPPTVPPSSYSMALPTKAQSNSSNDGWSLTYWTAMNPVVLRHTGSIYTNPGPTLYHNDVETAQNANAVSVLGHARNSSFLGTDPDPHPFVYFDLFGKTWALVHNGGIDADYLVELEDTLGAGFIALDSIRSRFYTNWGMEDYPDPDSVCLRLDTEYMALMLMKYYLVAENYYWSVAGIDYPMEWAINQTINRIRTGTDRYTALNFIVSNNDDMWLAFQRDATDPYDHFTSYLDASYSPDARIAYTTSIPDITGQQDWHQLSTMGNAAGRYVHLKPGLPTTEETFNGGATPAMLPYPNELRINGQEYSTGAQTDPAVASCPDGAFVVVWASSTDNQIKARAYNQMGLAETKEIVISGGGTVNRATPAVSFNRDGTGGYIVWKERNQLTRDYRTIKGRAFTWGASGRVFQLTGREDILTRTTCRYVNHPAVACGLGTDYGVTWERQPSATGGTEIRWAVRSLQFTGSDIAIAVPMSTNESYLEPDITYLDDNRYVMVYEYVAPPFGTYAPQLMGVVMPMDPPVSGMPHYLAETRMTDVKKAHPSIAAINAGQIVIGYYRDRSQTGISAEIYNCPAGTASIQYFRSVRTPEVVTSPSVTNDIAVLNDETFYICYPKLNGTNNWDIWTARREGDRFVDQQSASDPNNTRVQTNPSIAIAYKYGATTDWYAYHSYDNPPRSFMHRRMVVWQSDSQDGDNWAVVGEFRGIRSDHTLAYWSDRDLYNECEPAVGFVHRGEPGELDENGTALNMESPAVIPMETRLNPSYPNPFNPTTMISYDLAEAGEIRVDVFDLNGRLVRVLADGYQLAGSYALTFDGADLSAGTYFVRMNSSRCHTVQKLLLIK